MVNPQPFLRSSVPRDPSEIIFICCVQKMVNMIVLPNMFMQTVIHFPPLDSVMNPKFKTAFQISKQQSFITL